jgi:hypothetical protein
MVCGGQRTVSESGNLFSQQISVSINLESMNSLGADPYPKLCQFVLGIHG